MTRPDYWKDCTIECETTQRCVVCDRTKKPVGRYGGPYDRYMCDDDCEGYRQDPKPGHLWPGEIADMDREEEE